MVSWLLMITAKFLAIARAIKFASFEAISAFQSVLQISMIDLSDVNAMRPVLAMMARARHLRINPPTLDVRRHNWRPIEVIEDATRSRFTDEGAWEFIAECLEKGVIIECKPPCEEHQDFAYIMIAPEAPDSRRIYMKVAILPPHKLLNGISFHFERS